MKLPLSSEIRIERASDDNASVLLAYLEQRCDAQTVPKRWHGAIVERAESRFLYVKHFRDVLESGVFREVDELPTGRSFYEEYLKLIMDKVGSELFEQRWGKALTLLAASRYPVPLDLLHDWGLPSGTGAEALRDLRGMFSIRSWSGRGRRWYLLMQVPIGKSALSLKYSRTYRLGDVEETESVFGMQVDVGL